MTQPLIQSEAGNVDECIMPQLDCTSVQQRHYHAVHDVQLRGSCRAVVWLFQDLLHDCLSSSSPDSVFKMVRLHIITWFLASLAVAPTVEALLTNQFPADVTALMDPSISPCDDFYLYACGGWMKNTSRPPDRPHFSYAGAQVDDRNREALLQIYSEGRPIVSDLFQSCMDMEQINAIGTKPLQETRARLAAVMTKPELFQLAGELSEFGPSVFIETSVYPDMLNPTFHVLEVAVAPLTLGHGSMYTDPSNWATYEQPYREYLTKIFTLNGMDDSATLATNVERVVQLEQQMASGLQASDDQADPDDPAPMGFYHPVEFQSAINEYPLLVGAFVDQGLNLLTHSSLKPSDHIVVYSVVELRAMEQFVTTASLDLLQTLLEFRFLEDAAKHLGEAFTAARFDLFDRTIRGQTKPVSREKYCATVVQQAFPDLVGKLFAEARFNDQSEQLAQSMAGFIQSAMQTRLEAATWLDESTRRAALMKLHQMIQLVGHSNTVEDFDPKLLHSNTFLANAKAISQWTNHRKLGQVGNAVDRTKWTMSGALVNAMYNPAANVLTFPAGMMQPPYFDVQALAAQNFGAYATVMGHEVTHGFDTTGQHFDGVGKWVNWWSNATEHEFTQRKKCLETQYSRFQLVSDTNASLVLGQVNGKQTIGENIADNGGFGLALDAFHQFQSKTNPPPPSSPLSRHDLDRLFFISHAQSYCAKDTDGYQRVMLQNPHSPGHFRVVGVVQNDERFGELFQCHEGTAMNPHNKCKIW